MELPSKEQLSSKDQVNKELFLQLANFNPCILRTLLTRHTKIMKPPAGKSKEDTADEDVYVLTQIGVWKEEIELV